MTIPFFASSRSRARCGFVVFSLCLGMSGIQAANSSPASESQASAPQTAVQPVKPKSPAASAAEEKEKSAGIPAVIFVRNVAGASLNGREQAFEDLVSARVGGIGLLPMSRAEVVNRMGAGRVPAIGIPPEATLEDQTTALRLAQNLGADYILTLSLVSLDKEVRHFTGSGVSTVNTLYTLRTSWKLLEAGQGGAITGGTVAATRTFRDSGSLTETVDDVTNSLLADAAVKVTEAVRTRLTEDAARVAAARPKESERVNFTINVMAENIFFPELTVGQDGTLRITNPRGSVSVDSAVVELDGVTIGSATSGSAFKARPGLHRLRLSRDGFKPWEGMVNLFEGFAFNATLELTDAGVARWREQSHFIQDLKNGAKLTDARVKEIESYAQMLRQSGFKIDYKVDAKEFPSQDINVIH